MTNRLETLTKLKQGYVTLEFTKADGSKRMMEATLADSELPSPMTLDEAQKAGSNVVVYERDTGFRTFNWARLQTVDGEGFGG